MVSRRGVDDERIEEKGRPVASEAGEAGIGLPQHGAVAMRELGLKSRVCQRFTPTTTQADPSKQPADNKLDRDFAADAPNRKWVTDITYLATAAGWVYLAVVVDLFSRKAVD